MADIEQQLIMVQEKMQQFQKEQNDKMLEIRDNYQRTIDEVINEAQQSAMTHKEILKRKYLAAYDDVVSQLENKFEGTLKQVQNELESLRHQTNNRIEEARRQLLENTNRIETFQKEQKDLLEHEKRESKNKMINAKSSYDDISRNYFFKILYGSILPEYQRMCNLLEFYYNEGFYQTVLALALSLARDCNIKKNEICIYMDKYAKRILALKSDIEKYKLLMDDNYKNEKFYGRELCRKEKIDKSNVDESFIDFWSYGMFGQRASRLNEGISFLKEHGIIIDMEYDVSTVLESIEKKLNAQEEIKEKLIEYINIGEIIVYDKEKKIREEMISLQSENHAFGTSINLYNDRLIFAQIIEQKMSEYQYYRIEDNISTVKATGDGGLDCRIGVSLKYENDEGLQLEICIIAVKNNLENRVENQIAIVVDYEELGLIAEQYINEVKSILYEVPLLKDCVIETCGDINASVASKYVDMQKTLYDKCNPHRRS